jgi:hypothetical protein
MFLSRGNALRLPHGTTARVRPYKSQNVFLKNYNAKNNVILFNFVGEARITILHEGLTYFSTSV